MLDAKEINQAIAELEIKESSYNNYIKLASLYAIRDKMTAKESVEYSSAARPSHTASHAAQYRSDFLQAANSKDIGDVLNIIDDLMDTIKVVNEKIYNRVMRDIRNL